MSTALPSFSDVVMMIKTIPNQNDVERMMRWAKEKYRVEVVLEEKVEKMEKLIAKREYELRNAVAKVKNLRLEIAKHDVRRGEQASENRVLQSEKKELESVRDKQLTEINDLKVALDSARDDKVAKLRKDQDTKEEEKEKNLLKLTEANSRLTEKMEQHSELEKKFIQQQQDNKQKLSELETKYRRKIRKMNDQMRLLDVNHSNEFKIAWEKQNIEKKFQNQITEQTETIKTLKEAVKTNCEKLATSQDKLVAQMEKNAELQDEVKELTKKIQNLGVDELSDDGEKDYSSDGSFEKIDEEEM